MITAEAGFNSMNTTLIAIAFMVIGVFIISLYFINSGIMKSKDSVISMQGEKLKAYREDNQTLRDENKRLEGFELKVKIMEMYVNDDEAINELLECHKEKSSFDPYENQRRAIANIQAQQRSLYGGLGAAGGAGSSMFNQLAAARGM